MHTYLRAYMHACIHACIHTCIHRVCSRGVHLQHVHTHACMHACIHTCMHALCLFTGSAPSTCTHACMHTYIHTCSFTRSVPYNMHTHTHGRHLTDHQYWGVHLPGAEYLAQKCSASKSQACYTQGDVELVIQRGRKLGVKVIPELDLPVWRILCLFGTAVCTFYTLYALPAGCMHGVHAVCMREV